MATIPEVRKRLEEIAATQMQLAIETQELTNQLWRRRATKVTRAKSTPMSYDLLVGIRAYARANPDLNQQEVGNHFHVSQGRVSEALRGKRY